MRALAERCELSPNTISLIERGVTSPSVSTLHRLATALKVPITAFFEESEDRLQVIASRPGDRSFSGSGDLLLESLGSGLDGQTLEPFVVTLQPGAGSGQQAIIHDGHELVYCLSGKLQYVIDDHAYSLEVGESLLFEAQKPHRWSNQGDQPAVFLLVFEAGGQDEPAERHLQA
jgi:quercetin dioxygenase-like cupin family protein/DNA-binding XRE family transcriptional regulator